MDAIREMIHLDTNRLIIDLPKRFSGKNVEVIVLPSAEPPHHATHHHAKCAILAHCAGAWQGEELIREANYGPICLGKARPSAPMT